MDWEGDGGAAGEMLHSAVNPLEWPALPEGWTWEPAGEPVIYTIPVKPKRFENDCRVYWGSHGCERERGHRGHHRCDPCHGHPWWLHAILRRLGYGSGCVERWPYYGRKTRFYGEDAPARDNRIAP